MPAVSCPHCRRALTVPDSQGVSVVRCPCGQNIRVPGPAAELQPRAALPAGTSLRRELPRIFGNLGWAARWLLYVFCGVAILSASSDLHGRFWEEQSAIRQAALAAYAAAKIVTYYTVARCVDLAILRARGEKGE